MYALVSMLYNTAGKTYHPIVYREAFFPGGPDATINRDVVRLKSYGHHTTGFTDEDQARDEATSCAIMMHTDTIYTGLVRLGRYDLWDGEDIPADVLMLSRLEASLLHDFRPSLYKETKAKRDEYRVRCASANLSNFVTRQQDIDGKNMEQFCRTYEDTNGMART